VALMMRIRFCAEFLRWWVGAWFGFPR